MSAPLCGLDEYGNLQKAEIELPPLPNIPYPMPIGTVLAYYGTTPPAHTLACNGAAISRTDYAELFAVIGTTAGAGDGSTTFNVPDLRGVFIRGLDNGRGLDPGRALGTFQMGTRITGEIGDATAGATVQSTFNIAYCDGDPVTSGYTGILTIAATQSIDAGNAYWRITRPYNVAMTYCIVYEN